MGTQLPNTDAIKTPSADADMFERMVGQFTTPVFLYSKHQEFVYANAAGLALVQKTWEEIAGRNLFEAFPDEPERIEAIRKKHLDCLAGKVTYMDALPYEIELDGERKLRYWQSVQEPFRSACGNITHVIQRIQDVTDQVELHRQRDAISKELDHRVKNLIAVVSATAMIAGQSATSVEQFTEDFNARLRAMDRTYSRLNDTNWRGMALRDLLVQELRQFRKVSSRAHKLDGPDLRLSIQLTKDVAMLTHEMVTNAAKFGCFSTPDGHLDVRWELKEDHIQVVWQESGLKGVVAPTRQGFGRQLFEMMPYIEAKQTFNPTGLHVVAKLYGTMTDGEFRARA